MIKAADAGIVGRAFGADEPAAEGASVYPPPPLRGMNGRGRLRSTRSVIDVERP